MNIHINTKYKSAIFLVCILFCFPFLQSCKKFLQVDLPISQVADEAVFSDDISATATILGVYAELIKNQAFAGGNVSSVMNLSGLSGDELISYRRQDPAQLEFEENQISPANTYISGLWKSLYTSVYSLNAIVEGVGKSKQMSENVKSQLLGEALFTRAFCYFYLINLFGDVPLVLTTDYQYNSIVTRTSKDTIQEMIIADLERAKSLLGEKYTAVSEERIRPNKFAALALLARVYLYSENWEKAEEISSTVINSDHYSINEDLTQVFLANSSEAIWQLRPIFNNNNGYTYEARLFSPSRVVNNNVMRKQILSEIEDGDSRLTNWIGRIIRSGDTLYFPYKYRQDVLTAPMTEYSMVLRLAEQYLIRAEARARQDNLVGANSANSDLQVIRSRAGLAEMNIPTQEGIVDAILKERRIEFIGEWAHRWFDLNRLGLSVSVIGAIKPQFDLNDQLYPIPASEFEKNPRLGNQNSGY